MAQVKPDKRVSTMKVKPVKRESSTQKTSQDITTKKRVIMARAEPNNRVTTRKVKPDMRVSTMKEKHAWRVSTMEKPSQATPIKRKETRKSATNPT